MKNYIYQNRVFSGKELAEFTGVKYTTLMSRLARGYTVEEAVADCQRVPKSVNEFYLASHPPDWDGMINSDLYDVYLRWCNKQHYAPESDVHFIRSIKRLVPNLRVVPSRVNAYGQVRYKRLIRIDNRKDGY